MNRYIGIDYGTKRVGLAISDGLGLMARPLEVVSRKGTVDRIRELAETYPITAVVVGLPTSLGGFEGPSAAGARELGERISSETGLTVEYVDEKFTSRMAEGALVEKGMKRRDRRETVNKVAAAIILQDYLDARRPDGN